MFKSGFDATLLYIKNDIIVESNLLSIYLIEY